MTQGGMFFLQEAAWYASQVETFDYLGKQLLAPFINEIRPVVHSHAVALGTEQPTFEPQVGELELSHTCMKSPELRSQDETLI